ncbi:hypothetical protein HK096_003124 [Nowakowskiella sp. JEL0078]|nr:hypothetical protein HK096_003124 [Nowakowskiella sp. JEL0078]
MSLLAHYVEHQELFRLAMIHLLIKNGLCQIDTRINVCDRNLECCDQFGVPRPPTFLCASCGGTGCHCGALEHVGNTVTNDCSTLSCASNQICAYVSGIPQCILGSTKSCQSRCNISDANIPSASCFCQSNCISVSEEVMGMSKGTAVGVFVGGGVGFMGISIYVIRFLKKKRDIRHASVFQQS